MLDCPPAFLPQHPLQGILGYPVEDVVGLAAVDIRQTIVLVGDEVRLGKVEGMQAQQRIPVGTVVGKGHQVASVPLREMQADLHQLRMQEVVAVHQQRVVALQERKRVVARGGDARVRLVDDAEARIPRRVPVQDGGGAVRAAVIHADRLPVREGLRQQAVQAAREEGFHVVNRDDNGYAGSDVFH